MVTSGVSRVRASSWESSGQKVRRIVARARFALQNAKTWSLRKHGKLLVGKNAHENVAGARLIKRNRKNRGEQTSAGFVWWSPHCWCCAEVGRFITTLYAGLQPAVTRLIGSMVWESISDVATLLLCGIAARGCKHCSSCVKGSSSSIGPRLCYAELPLEVAKRRKEELGCRSYRL